MGQTHVTGGGGRSIDCSAQTELSEQQSNDLGHCSELVRSVPIIWQVHAGKLRHNMAAAAKGNLFLKSAHGVFFATQEGVNRHKCSLKGKGMFLKVI